MVTGKHSSRNENQWTHAKTGSKPAFRIYKEEADLFQEVIVSSTIPLVNVGQPLLLTTHHPAYFHQDSNVRPNYPVPRPGILFQTRNRRGIDLDRILSPEHQPVACHRRYRCSHIHLRWLNLWHCNSVSRRVITRLNISDGTRDHAKKPVNEDGIYTWLSDSSILLLIVAACMLLALRSYYFDCNADAQLRKWAWLQIFRCMNHEGVRLRCKIKSNSY